MKDFDKKQEDNNPVKQVKQKSKSRRRDLFQTAPISRNIFQSQNNDIQQYTNQTIKKITKAQSVPIQIRPQIIKKQQEQNQPIEIKFNTNFKNDNVNLEQKSPGFIFEASSSSDEQAHQKADNHHNVQIIFKDSESDNEEQQNKIKNKNKSIVQLFGQKVQVNMQVNWDQNSQDMKNKNKKQQSISLVPLNTVNTQETKKPKQFLKAYSCMPYNTFAKLKLVRNKNSQGGQTFIVYLESNLRYIMSAKNTTGNTYILSENFDSYIEHGQYYLGKAKSSFFGNQLNLYTKGLQPQKAKSKNQIPRQIICTAITHSQQIMDDVKPRDFTVYLLKPEFSYYKDLVGVKLYQDQIPLDKLFNEHQANRDKIFLFQNRKSKWNQKQKMHSLNMKGRAKLPSVKNFILQNPAQNGRQIMLFGKMDQNQFSFDIHYPISPFIGMAIALTSFSHKSW